MRKKYLLIGLLFIAIGFATVTTTLLINGTSTIKKKDDAFKVYYSDALVNGNQDLSVVVDDTHLSFKTTLDTLGQTYVLDYDVTNSSKQYDAQLTMNCTGGNEYLTVVNSFNTTDNLLATDTRRGKLTLTLAKSYSGVDMDVEIECTLGANAVERNSEATGTPKDPVQSVSVYSPKQGDELCIDTECFYVIANDNNEISMLSKYNLNVGGVTHNVYGYTRYETYTGLQDPDMTYVSLGGGYSPALQQYEIHGVVNWDHYYSGEQYNADYQDYISNTLGVPNKAESMNEAQLNALGCDIDTMTCTDSPEWLYTYDFGTGVNIGDMNDRPIVVDGNGIRLFDQEMSFSYNGYPSYGVRPVVTITKDTFNDLFGDKIVLSVQTFCNNKGFTYGMLAPSTYYDGPTIGDSADAYFLCSDSEDFDDVYSFDIDGNPIDDFPSGEQGEDPGDPA